MAPELFMTLKPKLTLEGGKKSDTFSVGIIVGQILMDGRHPFEGVDSLYTQINIREDKRDGLKGLNDAVKQNLVYNLTEAHPNDRVNAAQAQSHPYFKTLEWRTELLKVEIWNQRRWVTHIQITPFHRKNTISFFPNYAFSGCPCQHSRERIQC